MIKYKEYTKKKCKNFGYTFAIIFLILFVYDYYYWKRLYLIYLSICNIFILTTIIKPTLLKFPGFYWEKLGLILGKLLSPIILMAIYILTILPINIIMRIFRIDILKKKKIKKATTYWVKNKNKSINFHDQF